MGRAMTSVSDGSGHFTVRNKTKGFLESCSQERKKERKRIKDMRVNKHERRFMEQIRSCKLMVIKLVKKSPRFYGANSYLTVSTKGLERVLSQMNPVQIVK